MTVKNSQLELWVMPYNQRKHQLEGLFNVIEEDSELDTGVYICEKCGGNLETLIEVMHQKCSNCYGV